MEAQQFCETGAMRALPQVHLRHPRVCVRLVPSLPCWFFQCELTVAIYRCVLVLVSAGCWNSLPVSREPVYVNIPLRPTRESLDPLRSSRLH